MLYYKFSLCLLSFPMVDVICNLVDGCTEFCTIDTIDRYYVLMTFGINKLFCMQGDNAKDYNDKG